MFPGTSGLFRTCRTFRTMFRTFLGMLAKMGCWPRDMWPRSACRSWLILLPRWRSPFEAKIKTDIPKSQHLDFRHFDKFWMNFDQCWVIFWPMLAKCSKQSGAKHVPNVPPVPNVPNTNIVLVQLSVYMGFISRVMAQDGHDLAIPKLAAGTFSRRK